MPKKAYDSLPEEKRAEMLEKAMALYCSHPFSDITLNMILDALAMHPATFYRYFDDKNELYVTALRAITAKRAEYLKKGNGRLSFFRYEEGTQPLSDLEVCFSRTAMNLPEEVLMQLYLRTFREESFTAVKDELRRMRYDGKLRSDVDEDLIAYIYATVQFNLQLFFRDFGITDEDIMVKQQRYLVSFFRHGLMTDEAFEQPAE